MKQVTYQIKGMVIETMLPAITASCESLAGVRNVRVTVTDTDSAKLILTLAEANQDALEQDLSRIMTAKGLELCLPALTVADVPKEAPAPTASSTAPSPGDAPLPKQANHYVMAPPPKEGKKISLTAAISTVITAVVLAVLLTFSLTTAYMKNDLPNVVQPGQGSEEEDAFAELDMIDRLFRSATMMEDLDEDVIITAVLKGYVAATGDLYAEYFTAEEFKEQTSTQNGEMCGIGVSVVNATIEINGISYQVITVANVYPDSPAEAAGVLPGDHIMFVGTGDDKTLVQDIGYTEALNRMKGEEGSECAFSVYRRPQGSDDSAAYEEVEITAIRKKLTTRSVIGRVHAEDPTVGIIKMTGFDNTTRDQFVEAVETLKTQGCQYFVFDLRNNPGGLLTSVEDVLIFFLQEGDTVISTKDSSGRESVTKIAVNAEGYVTCGSGQLKREDIGKYRDLTFSVLVNEYSASAAELFTANIRDYELGKIVGVTTYGKGSMQTTFSLSRYGYDGALKLTTAHYFPPCGEGYDGIGITPSDGKQTPLSEEAQKYNINLLPDALDNQLAEAIKTMK
ncbi:MAG: PDZ domain-containing protein [Clostridia bacterium]|nr:PDZ domain-containing protein [Clostridia bacterium]